jgi:hypothetical protein
MRPVLSVSDLAVIVEPVPVEAAPETRGRAARAFARFLHPVRPSRAGSPAGSEATP